jgi:rsbT co-antagonist protein RsbR
VQRVLEQAQPLELAEWLGVLGDYMLQGNQAAAQVLESRMEELIAQRTVELTETQRMLQLVLDTIPMGVFWKDQHLRYLGCNQLFARDSGIKSSDKIVGKTDFDLGWADQAELYHFDDRQVMESGTPKLNYEETQTMPDGSQIWLRISKVPLLDAEGNVTGILGVYDDITDLKTIQAERERLQQEIIEAQRQAIQELSTPVIPIMDRIIVMPLIGSIDTLRARDITRRLLAGITEQRARVVILDITGVPVVDSGVADHLNKTIQAARLKGARAIVTGISDAVAETVVDLGIDWSGIETLSDLQTGLMAALNILGMGMSRQAARQGMHSLEQR